MHCLVIIQTNTSSPFIPCKTLRIIVFNRFGCLQSLFLSSVLLRDFMFGRYRLIHSFQSTAHFIRACTHLDSNSHFNSRIKLGSLLYCEATSNDIEMGNMHERISAFNKPAGDYQSVFRTVLEKEFLRSVVSIQLWRCTEQRVSISSKHSSIKPLPQDIRRCRRADHTGRQLLPDRKLPSCRATCRSSCPNVSKSFFAVILFMENIPKEWTKARGNRHS